MTSAIIDESAIAEALRIGEPGQAIKRLLKLQGLGLWHGDLSEMRGDVPRSPAPLEPLPPTDEAKEMMRHMKMVRTLRDALDHLSPERREALSLRYGKLLPIEEIAGRLGVTTPVATELLREALSGVQAMYVQTVDGRDEL
jgi:DNA-directed RNA polymerase specialized sigma24 family protein